MFVSIDYANAILQAKRLEKVAEEYDDVLKSIEKQLSIIEDSWKGAAAEVFKEKLNTYKTQNKKMQSEIRSTAGAIKNVVQIIKEADEAAAANSAVQSVYSGGGRRG